MSAKQFTENLTANLLRARDRLATSNNPSSATGSNSRERTRSSAGQEKPMSEAPMNSNSDKVLVVVEEPSLRSQLRRTIESFGFDPGEATRESARPRLHMVNYQA